MTRRWVAVLAAAVITAACGGTGLAPEAAEDLQQRTAAIRVAAEAGDIAAAEEAIDGLRSALNAHLATGAVDEERAAEIAAAADTVAERLDLLAPPPDADEEPAPAEPPPPSDDPADTPAPEETTPSPETTPPETQQPIGPPDDGDDEDDRDGDDGDDGENGDEGGDDGDGGDGRGPDGEGPPGQRDSR